MAIEMRFVSVVLIACALVTLAREAHVTGAERQSEVARVSAGANGTAAQSKAPASPAAAVSSKPAGTDLGKAKKAEEEFEVGGRVVDPERKPFLGANVYVVRDDQAPQLRAVTDAQGRFQFRMAKWELALKDAPSPSYVLAVGKGFGVDFRPAVCLEVSGKLGASLAFPPYPLAPQWDRTLRLVKDDVPVLGRVVDAKGRPIADAKIGVVEIWATEKEDLTCWLEAAESGEDYDVTRELMDRGPWMGRIDTVMPTATTGSDGRFSLKGGIGRERIVRLMIEGPQIVSRTIYARTRPGTTLRIPHLLESPLGGMFTFYGATFEHVAQRSIPIVGTVRDRDAGKPIAGVSIRGRSGIGSMELDVGSADAHVRVVTDSEGRYRLSGMPIGKGLRVLAVPQDGLYLPSGKSVDLHEGREFAQVDFELKRGIKIHGRVTEASTGEPVQAHVSYFVFLDNPHLRSAPFFRGVTSDEDNLTDERGAYATAGLPARGLITARAKDLGAYQRGAGPGLTKGRDPRWPFIALHTDPSLCIPFNHHYLAEVNLVEDADGYEHHIVLDSLPAFRLEGAVLDPAGQPLWGCFFFGREFEPSYFIPLNSATFTVRLRQADEVRRLLFVHKERKLAGSLILKGAKQGPLSVRLQPWGVVSGRVVDAQGKPKANVLILGQAPPQRAKPPDYGWLPERHYRTDQEGRFHIEGLAPKMKYDLEVVENFQRVGLVAVDVTVESGQTKDLGDLTILPPARQPGRQ